MTTLICLVGEQPIPNLLPIKYLQPERVILVHSDRTAAVSDRLKRLLAGTTAVTPVEIDAYDIAAIQDGIHEKLSADERVIVNLTGGTKPMSLGAMLLAFQQQAELVYLESEQKQSVLYRYRVTDGSDLTLYGKEPLPTLITLDDYLRAHVDLPPGDAGADISQKEAHGFRFQRAVAQALRPPVVDEQLVEVKLGGAIDVDLAVRVGNQVALIETKTGKQPSKKGIDQLNTVGGRGYLGTYAYKLLVTDHEWDARSNLCALADARRITVLPLTSFAAHGALSPEDTARLREQVRNLLGPAAP